jgi:exodeoxyribonuclease III
LEDAVLEPESLRLISWNVQQGSLPAAQVEALSHRQPHIVALQDVFYTVAPEFQDKLKQIGLPYSAYTLPNPPLPILQPAVRDSNARLSLPERLRHPKIGVLVASAWPLTVLTSAETNIHVPWPERLLSVTIASPWGAIELHNVYLPHAGHILVLYHMLRVLYAGLATPSEKHRILCGDLNLPVDELADGRIITHGQKLVGDHIIVKNAPMDKAEHLLLQGLAPFGLVDVFRLLYGYGQHGWSYMDTKPPYRRLRLDHVLASPTLRAQLFRYQHAWRESSPPLSDHAAAEVDFAPELLER